MVLRTWVETFYYLQPSPGWHTTGTSAIKNTATEKDIKCFYLTPAAALAATPFTALAEIVIPTSG
jgi:hypothetical protein